MAISVIDPIGTAFNHMTRILFKRFSIGKWFVLGFCAFLAHLGEGGGFNFPTNWGGGRPGGGGGTSGQDIVNWIKAHLPLIIGIAVAIVVFIVVITLVLMWLKSRGKFMFIDGIVRNRGAVVEPWKEFRALGNSLFGFLIALAFISFLAFGLIIGMCVLIAWPDIQAQQFGGASVIAIIAGILVLFATAITLGIIGFLLDGLVIPTMYLRNERVMAAWSTVRRELISGHVGAIVLLFLMNFVLSIGAGVAALTATCATCCIALLPYIGTVILLPILVFMRCYTLCFIEQYGPQWRLFAGSDDVPRCARCGYQLHGLPISGSCPECGNPYNMAGAITPPPEPPPA